MSGCNLRFHTLRDTKIQLIKINFTGDTSNAKLLQLYGCPLLISF